MTAPPGGGPELRLGTPAGRWVLAATVLGTSVAFLDATIVNVALPRIADDLDAGLAGLQWVLDAYLVALVALLLVGGSLGDRYGRRRTYLVGLGVFTVASVACAAAPTIEVLVAARAVQGVGSALLTPGSLAIVSATFHRDDRAAAVGVWSGLGALAGAAGPLVGGSLVDAASWRFGFLINVPVAVLVLVAARHVPETRDPDAARHLDLAGAATAAAALALLATGLIEGGAPGVVAAVAGGAGLVGFVVLEARRAAPMLPLELFRSRQFSGANATTLAVYAGLGVASFVLVLQLQLGMGYSALEAGTALAPSTVLLLVVSPRAAAWAQRHGPRLPMTVGPIVAAVGLALLSRVGPGDHYVVDVLPGAVVYGLGLSVTVAPLTATVLGAVEERHLGVGSAVNNAVARLASLLGTAAIPTLVGLDLDAAGGLGGGQRAALLVAAGLCAAGGLIAALTIRSGRPTRPTGVALAQPCGAAELAATARGDADAA